MLASHCVAASLPVSLPSRWFARALRSTTCTTTPTAAVTTTPTATLMTTLTVVVTTTPMTTRMTTLTAVVMTTPMATLMTMFMPLDMYIHMHTTTMGAAMSTITCTDTPMSIRKGIQLLRCMAPHIIRVMRTATLNIPVTQTMCRKLVRQLALLHTRRVTGRVRICLLPLSMSCTQATLQVTCDAPRHSLTHILIRHR